MINLAGQHGGAWGGWTSCELASMARWLTVDLFGGGGAHGTWS